MKIVPEQSDAFMNKTLSDFFSKTAFSLLCLFTFCSALKFGLPYTYNITPMVPQNFLELCMQSWPVEWGELLLLFSSLFFLASLFLKTFLSLPSPLSWKLSSLDFLVLLYSASILLSLFVNGFLGGGLQTALLFLSYGLYYFLIRLLCQNEKRQRFLFIALISSYVITACYGFYQHFEGLEETYKTALDLDLPALQNSQFLTRLKGKKIFSTFIYSNSLAGYLCLMIPLLGFLCSKKITRKALFSGFLLGGLVFAGIVFILSHSILYQLLYGILWGTLPLSGIYLLFLTRSKGALIALFLSAFISLCFLFKKPSFKFPPLLLFIAAGLLLGAYSLRSQLELSGKVRLEYTEASLKMIAAHPLFGTGPGSYGTHYFQYKTPGAEEVQLAHNDFLQIWAECGFLAFLSFSGLFLWGLGSCFKNAFLKTPGNLFLLLALLSSGMHHGVDFDLYVPSLGFLTFFLFTLLPQKNRAAPLVIPKGSSRALLLFSFFSLISVSLLIAQISSSLIHSELGGRSLQKQAPQKALFHFRESIRLYPYSLRPYLSLTQIFSLLKQQESAENTFEKALDIFPENAILWVRYASCLAQGSPSLSRQKKIKNALKEAKKRYPLFFLQKQKRLIR